MERFLAKAASVSLKIDPMFTQLLWQTGVEIMENIAHGIQWGRGGFPPIGIA
jgi:hypothetical protein